MCSHQRAYKYFAESIYISEPYLGYKCDSLDNIKQGNCSATDQSAKMGGEPGSYEQPMGIYYLQTNEQPQYYNAQMKTKW